MQSLHLYKRRLFLLSPILPAIPALTLCWWNSPHCLDPYLAFISHSELPVTFPHVFVPLHQLSKYLIIYIISSVFLPVVKEFYRRDYQE